MGRSFPLNVVFVLSECCLTSLHFTQSRASTKTAHCWYREARRKSIETSNAVEEAQWPSLVVLAVPGGCECYGNEDSSLYLWVTEVLNRFELCAARCSHLYSHRPCYSLWHLTRTQLRAQSCTRHLPCNMLRYSSSLRCYNYLVQYGVEWGRRFQSNQGQKSLSQSTWVVGIQLDIWIVGLRKRLYNSQPH